MRSPPRSWRARDTILHWYCGLNSVFEGNLTNCLRPLDPKRSILFHQSEKKKGPFLFRPLLTHCNLSRRCLFSSFFFQQWAFEGLLPDRLSSRRGLVVTLLTLKLYTVHYSREDRWLSLCWDISQSNQMRVFIHIFLPFWRISNHLTE